MVEENLWEKIHTQRSTVKMATDMLFDSPLVDAYCQILPCHCYIWFLAPVLGLEEVLHTPLKLDW